jgi:hypothetical protein
MRKPVYVALAFLLLTVSLIPTACAMLEVSVHVYVYSDQQWRDRAFWVYGYCDWRVLAEGFIFMVSYNFECWFNIRLTIVHYREYQPPTLNDEILLRNFCSAVSNQEENTTAKTIYILLTGQDMYRQYANYRDYGTLGIAYNGSMWWRGSMVVEFPTFEQQLIEHELGHLYGCNHCANNCLMNPQQFDSTFCDYHFNTILSNRERFGYTYPPNSRPPIVPLSEVPVGA